MSLKSKIILDSLLGAIGGLVGWAVIEILMRGFLQVEKHPAGELVLGNAKTGILAGIFIGGSLGAADGIWSRSARMCSRAILAGAGAGAAAGLVGVFIGQVIYGSAVVDSDDPSFAAFIIKLFARAAGWAIVGAALGAAQGVPNMSSVRARHGAIGGAIGGLMGGASFEIVANIVRTDSVSRLVGFTLIGLFTGFMIGLVQELLKQAWVVVLHGHNEGREIPIYNPVTTIGRDELADVPVYADRGIGPRHALIRQEGGRHRLEDLGSSTGTLVNGQKATKQLLKDRDTIEIGSVKLLFREKATQSRHVPAPDTPRSSPVNIPTSARICPFCGGIKDAAGNCDCSVGAAPPDTAPRPAATLLTTPAEPAIAPTVLPEPTAAPGVARVVALTGPHAQCVFNLQPTETTIGREPGCGISLPDDSTVSRHHAHITREGSVYVIHDDGSSNGTFVNGAKVTEAALVLGDIIKVGITELRFEA